MKKAILFLALLFSASTFAEQVTLKQAKCTLFGHLKVKVYGLESYGKIGTGYLRGNLPLSDDCDEVREDFIQSMGRGTSEADVHLDRQIIIIRDRHDNDNDKMDKRWTCTTKERKTLTVDFPQFPYVTFKAVRERTLRINHYCR